MLLLPPQLFTLHWSLPYCTWGGGAEGLTHMNHNFPGEQKQNRVAFHSYIYSLTPEGREKVGPLVLPVHGEILSAILTPSSLIPY